MQVNRLSFDGFRNLCAGQLTADSGINVIYGDNAHGKTNLLEAIWLFSGARSFRGAKDAEYIMHGKEWARIGLDFNADGRDQTAEIYIGEKKNVTLNGVQLKNSGELAGSFRAVVFSPSHLSLIKDGPNERRRFLDTAIGQLKPKYIDLIRRYTRALQQRNSVLRDARFHTQLYDMLDVYDTELARLGESIAKTRMSFVKRLSECSVGFYEGISGGKEEFSVRYVPSGGMTADELYASIIDARNADITAGATSIGPHRDDLAVEINGNAARSFGSQGQQRSAVIALKMSEAAVISDIAGEQPVILLDDVMSELDEFRQDYILNHVKDRQVFITCCDRAAVGLLKVGRCFCTKNGTVTAVDVEEG